ncbi:MAG: F-type H+/Na+-transporting ATPase subunit alpha [Actinomycetota bacterium]|jgi:F-type H+-transporting ATPase subunit alpha|nr:F-type H+/Na+-transporting ATPase subunit alpha [Actinomycetota bacterium]
MTELSIRPEEIRDALERFVSSYQPEEADKAEVGRVVETGDGIARVEGLHSTMTNELLDFGDGVLGLALNLDVREIGCVVLGDAQAIQEGQEVRRTGQILSIPVGDGFLGRVVDPLGRPLDGKGDIEATERRVLEVQAPTVVQRQPVKEPLQTGVKAIDAMTAIGRGQRELIIGDRQTGKTAVALDAIINQRDNWKSGDPKRQVKCIYVAVGQKGSTVRQVVNVLEEADAMEYTTVVSAPASFPAAFKYLAPYAGSAIGQHWMYDGQHALIVFDDLSKQAEAYRNISLLLRRPAGREAYPGDVFYLHSRLLERCAKLSDELGAGSLTGLPIIETKGNDISAYIPTNVISITDGQIFLETDLFNSGVRPAINVGVSVSRVGGSAQIRALRTVSGRLRLDLAQYRELEAFAAFGSDLDRASKRALERGARLVELLKQPQYSPYPVERQVVSIWAGTTGALDDVPVADIRRFETDFLDHLAHEHNGIYESILESGKLEDDTVDAMKKAIEAFKKQFDSSEPLGDVNEAKAKAMAEGEEGAESVKVRKRAEKDDDGDSGNPKDKDDSGKAKDTGDAGKPKKESDSGGQKDSGDSGKPKKGSDSGKPKTESDSDKQKDS